MKSFDQHTAIATALGWKNIHIYSDNAGPDLHVGDPPIDRPLKYNRPDTTIPNYTKDLNETIQLCQQLTRDGWKVEIQVFPDYVWTCDATLNRNEKIWVRGISGSLAEAICEAFLRAYDLWND